MKNLLILLLFACAIGWSQDRPIRADVVFLDTLTTTERDALTMRPSQFALIANSTVDSVQAWIVDKWVNLGSTGSGETYTFGTGLTNTSGTITVTNPFEEADETKLDGIETNATEDQSDAEISTAFLNENPNTDLDGSGTSVTAGTNVTVTGSGTSGSPYVINSTASGTGDVTGPASSTDNAIVRFDATTGKIIQNSVVTIGDTGNADFGGGSLTDIGQIDVNTEISAWNIQLQRPDGLAGDAFIELNDNNGNANVLFNDQSNSNKLTYTNAETAQTIVIDDLSATDDQTASEVTVSATPVNYTPDDTSVEGHLAGIDDALSGLGGGTPTDDSVTAAKMADDDHGAFTYSSNVAALDDNSVNATAIQDFAVLFSKLSTSAIASQPQAEAGTASNVLMTPERTAQAITALAGGASDSGQTKTYEAGSTKTLALSDFLDSGSLTGKGKVIYHTANDTITTPTGLGQTGRYISSLHLLNGADSVYVKKGSGATLINRTIEYNGSGVSEDGIWATTDFILSITPSGAIEVDGSDTFLSHTEVTAIYNGNNAIDPTNEVNGTSGISLISNGTIASSATTPYNGSYSLEVDIADTSNHEINIPYSGVTSGVSLTITARFYRPSSGRSGGNIFMRVYSGEGVASSTSTTIGAGTLDSWVLATITFTPNATSGILTIDSVPAYGGIYRVDDLIFTQ